MDEYYEWIKELLKEENIDLDVLTTTKNPDVLTHIHDAVRDLRDSLEIVRQDISYVEKGIYSKAKVNKCALHGDQLVVSESSDEENFKQNIGGNSSTTSTHERPLNKLPKKIKERHVSAKTKCLLLGLPYYYPEKDDETESPDSSDLEELKKRCKRLREQYQVLQKKKKQKHQKKRVSNKVTSGSQTTSDAYSTLDSCYKQPQIQDTDDYPCNIRGKSSLSSHRITTQPTSSIRSPPKPTKYVATPQLVSTDNCKRDSDGHLSVPTLSEPDSVIFIADSKKSKEKTRRSDSRDKGKLSKKVTGKSETPDRERSKKERKQKKSKEPKPLKTESAIQTSPDTEQQRYARSRFLRSDRPKSARPERRLLRLNNYLCFKPESIPVPDHTNTDETLQVTKIVTDNIDEATNLLGKYFDVVLHKTGSNSEKNVS